MRAIVGFILIAIGCAIAPYAAGQVYRCNEGGNTVYSDKPCSTAAGGKVDITVTKGYQGIGGGYGPGLPPPKIGAMFTASRTLACKYQSDMEQALAIGEDAQAREKFIAKEIPSGQCLQIQDGKRVKLSAYTRDLTLVRVRQEGEIDEVWTFVTAILLTARL